MVLETQRIDTTALSELNNRKNIQIDITNINKTNIEQNFDTRVCK